MIQLFSPPKILGPTVCIICGKSNGGSVKKNRKIREIFEMKVPGNWDMCKEHKKAHQEGYIALVEAVQPECTLLDNGDITANGEPHRTGKIVHVKYETAEQLFKTAIDRTLPMVFCLPDITKRFEDMVRHAAKAADKKQGF